MHFPFASARNSCVSSVLLMADRTSVGVERNPGKSFSPFPDVLLETLSSIRYAMVFWLGNHVKSANSCCLPNSAASSPKLESFFVTYLSDDTKNSKRDFGCIKVRIPSFEHTQFSITLVRLSRRHDGKARNIVMNLTPKTPQGAAVCPCSHHPTYSQPPPIGGERQRHIDSSGFIDELPERHPTLHRDGHGGDVNVQGAVEVFGAYENSIVSVGTHQLRNAVGVARGHLDFRIGHGCICDGRHHFSFCSWVHHFAHAANTSIWECAV